MENPVIWIMRSNAKANNRQIHLTGKYLGLTLPHALLLFPVLKGTALPADTDFDFAIASSPMNLVGKFSGEEHPLRTYI